MIVSVITDVTPRMSFMFTPHEWSLQEDTGDTDSYIPDHIGDAVIYQITRKPVNISLLTCVPLMSGSSSFKTDDILIRNYKNV